MIEVLSKIQKTLKAPKSQYNKFGDYHYRNSEDILEGLKPLLPDNVTLCLSDEIILVGDRYYVKATATLTDGKTTIQSSAMAREPLERKGMDASQITGATSSYARKYALNGMFCIDDTKDADSDDNKEATKVAEKPKKPPTDKPEPQEMPDTEVNTFIGRIRGAPSLKDLDFTKKQIEPSLSAMSKFQKDTIVSEVKKRTAFLAQAPNDDLEANIGQ